MSSRLNWIENITQTDCTTDAAHLMPFSVRGGVYAARGYPKKPFPRRLYLGQSSLVNRRQKGSLVHEPATANTAATLCDVAANT